MFSVAPLSCFLMWEIACRETKKNLLQELAFPIFVLKGTKEAQEEETFAFNSPSR